MHRILKQFSKKNQRRHFVMVHDHTRQIFDTLKQWCHKRMFGRNYRAVEVHMFLFDVYFSRVLSVTTWSCVNDSFIIIMTWDEAMIVQVKNKIS
jgi:hypothetical protein